MDSSVRNFVECDDSIFVSITAHFPHRISRWWKCTQNSSFLEWKTDSRNESGERVQPIQPWSNFHNLFSFIKPRRWKLNMAHQGRDNPLLPDFAIFIGDLEYAVDDLQLFNFFSARYSSVKSARGTSFNQGSFNFRFLYNFQNLCFVNNRFIFFSCCGWAWRKQGVWIRSFRRGDRPAKSLKWDARSRHLQQTHQSQHCCSQKVSPNKDICDNSLKRKASVRKRRTLKTW